MARMTHEAAKEFENTGNTEIFNLADDGNSDKVQFMLNTMDDVLAYTTHSIKMKSRSGREYDRKIGCLKSHKNDPAGTCPLCDAGFPIKVARFVPLYSQTSKKAMLWERGSQFIDKILSNYVNRLVANGVAPKSRVTEVVRLGKKGDTNTTYQLFPMDTVPAADLSAVEVPDPEGYLIANWSKEDMTKYVSTGEIPQHNNNSDSENIQRRSRAPEQTPQTPAPEMSSFSETAVSSPEDLF